MIYETKGLALEQVDELYGIVSKAWKSRAFRPQVSFQDFEEQDQKARGMSQCRSRTAAELEFEKVSRR